MRRLTLLHFLGLRAPLAGSTCLYVNLLHHPDVFLSEKKETHCFTREFHKWPLSYHAAQFVVFFDERRKDPMELIMKVCRHIGVRRDIDWDSMALAKVINKNPESAIPDHVHDYLKELYRPEID